MQFCRAWCAKKTDTWDELCTWNGCRACTECPVVSQPQIEPPPAPPPLSPPPPPFCPAFCARKTDTWDVLCTWDGCGTCTECLPISARVTA